VFVTVGQKRFHRQHDLVAHLLQEFGLRLGELVFSEADNADHSDAISSRHEGDRAIGTQAVGERLLLHCELPLRLDIPSQHDSLAQEGLSVRTLSGSEQSANLEKTARHAAMQSDDFQRIYFRLIQHQPSPIVGEHSLECSAHSFTSSRVSYRAAIFGNVVIVQGPIDIVVIRRPRSLQSVSTGKRFPAGLHLAILVPSFAKMMTKSLK